MRRPHPARAQRYADADSLRYVVHGDQHCEDQAGSAAVRSPGADGHARRQVVQRDGAQHEQAGPPQAGPVCIARAVVRRRVVVPGMTVQARAGFFLQRVKQQVQQQHAAHSSKQSQAHQQRARHLERLRNQVEH